LRIKPSEVKVALKALESRQLDEIGLFSRTMESGRYYYNELKDRRALWDKN
jgi:hypothetical protein